MTRQKKKHTTATVPSKCPIANNVGEGRLPLDIRLYVEIGDPTKHCLVQSRSVMGSGSNPVIEADILPLAIEDLRTEVFLDVL
ncbi:hypothetical protein AVEN_100112-1 [Araneus ventricosus]|uniref:Uncharacterized protein n=1 Tax=Araneus ventricosus TaxID=182803 RepID=A0A4Y2V729_ARAVE|nr:hypothetical protein AVEN_100112-1 [Araneus ventricosus]